MKKRKGSALMFSIIIMVVGTILAMTLLILVRSDVRRSRTFRDSYINYYVANSGINVVLKYIDENESDFITWFENESKDLSFELQFPNTDENALININILPTGDEYEGFMQIQSIAGKSKRYYILAYSSSSITPIKYIER